MGGSSVTDCDAPSMGASIASVLGINGSSLRFRPHGSTQKAHVVLRRVAISEDSSSDGEPTKFVRFSLFAQKRIEVKPGKEILLTVASEDGSFKDQAIVFEGEFLTPKDQDNDSEEEETQVADEEEQEPFPPVFGLAMPPKVRRTWERKAEEKSSVAYVPPIMHTSIGVQAEPLYVSTSSQVQPLYMHGSIQTENAYSAIAVQADSPPSPIRNSFSVQTYDPCKYATTDAQTDETCIGTSYVDKNQVSEAVGFDEHTEIPDDISERSLSPMDLDSPSSSAPASLIFSPTTMHGNSLHLGLASYSPPSSIASSSCAWDIPKTPVGINPDDSNALVSTNLPICTSTPDPLPVSTPVIASKSEQAESLPDSQTQERDPDLFDIVFNYTLLGSIMQDGKTAPINDESAASTKSSPTPAHTAPQRPVVEASTASEVKAPKITQSLRETSSPSSLQSSAITQSTTPRTKPSVLTNAVASTSKLPAILVPIPAASGCKPHSSMSSRAQQKTSVPVLESGQNVQQGEWSLSSPPDVKEIAVLSASSLTNPLGIRPSAKPAYINQRVPPRAPRKLVEMMAAKKPVVVGASWSAGRSSAAATAPLALRSGLSASSMSASTPVAKPVPVSAPKAPKGANLSNIIPYVSPSPSPFVPPPPPSSVTPQPPPPLGPPPPSPPTSELSSIANGPAFVNKWKKVAAEKLATNTSTSVRPDSKPIPTPSISPKVAEFIPPPPATSPPALPPPTDSNPKHVPSLQISATTPQSIPPPPTTTPPALPPPSSEYWSSFGGPQFVPAKIVSNSFTGAVVPSCSTLPPTTKVANPPALLTSVYPDANAYEFHPLRIQQQTKDQPPHLAQTPKIGQQPPQYPRGMAATAGQSESAASVKSAPVSNNIPAAPMVHPLPPKPPQAACVPPRGPKRDRPSSPFIDGGFRRKRSRRTFRWPTVESSLTMSLEGKDDLSIGRITFNADGSLFAITCADRSIRIWSNNTRSEIARLSHNSQVIGSCWMDGDAGIITLNQDGLVSRWTRSGLGSWTWSKVLDTEHEMMSKGDEMCLAYSQTQNRIAVSFPQKGVKIWTLFEDSWQTQRLIPRQNVTALRFAEDGDAILGGTRDGVLWQAALPNGTLRALGFMRTKIISIEPDPTGAHVLVGVVGGSCYMVGIRQSAIGTSGIEQTFSCNETERMPSGGFGASFASRGQAILFGCVDGCVLIWDREKAAVVYGLEHEENDIVQAIACFGGDEQRDGCLITGTKKGQVSWWSQPVAAPNAADAKKRPRNL
ncbi:hypothetical protein BDQ12DRAFT_688960 [Crucibulum laeve]|uniref:WD40-repeat-containing domain protein n=1 Tax=Crucibulum laeve TaxID=68775 RepID=A0A5C3LSG4_9AGAR|nr:hypothetical protein BDQ12DRAFT_688960 [Crucibulum laeve]